VNPITPPSVMVAYVGPVPLPNPTLVRGGVERYGGGGDLQPGLQSRNRNRSEPEPDSQYGSGSGYKEMKPKAQKNLLKF
jgi:hypothetical protein